MRACDYLKSDRQVVMLALEECGLALRDASAALRNDRQVVLHAGGLIFKEVRFWFRFDSPTSSARTGHE